MTTLFVYGTLKRGGSNHAFLSGQQLLGVVHTPPGFTLFSLGAYPGMIPSPEDREGVLGELWSVDDACLAKLDELEGLAEGLYRRAAIPLAPPPSNLATVETYFYLRDLTDRAHIGSHWPV
jgi:gamma-glutamylaminecyclotransferase